MKNRKKSVDKPYQYQTNPPKSSTTSLTLKINVHASNPIYHRPSKQHFSFAFADTRRRLGLMKGQWSSERKN